MNVNQLTQLLKDASKEHHIYETNILGKPDENWAEWYAKWITDQIKYPVRNSFDPQRDSEAFANEWAEDREAFSKEDVPEYNTSIAGYEDEGNDYEFLNKVYHM